MTLAQLHEAILARESPTSLGALRVGLTVWFLLAWLGHAPLLAEHFTDASVLAGANARQAFPRGLSLLFWLRSPAAVGVFFAFGVVTHLAWILGWRTRVAALLTWVGWVSLMNRQPALYAMPDHLMMMLCTLLAIVPAGQGVSLDARAGRGGPTPRWCRALFQLQLAIVYSSTGWAKSGQTWVDGTALYYALANPDNRHFVLTPVWAAVQPWLLRPLTWAVLVWETSFAAFVAVHWLRALWPRLPDLRWVWLGVGVALHLGISALLYVGLFGMLAITTYVAFIEPQMLSRWRCGSGPSGSA